MFKFIIFFILLQIVFSINTVTELDLNKYQGRWYQMYGNKFDQTFQKNGNCITADYTIIPNNSNISVLNSEYSLTNQLEQITGYAYYRSDVNSKLNPGELTVHLDGVNFDSPYWIIEIGPEYNNYYDWAIVSDPLKISLFVLARDVNRFYDIYDQEIMDLLTKYEYDNIIKTQHINCNYVPIPN
jgi:lipocalin